MCRGIVARSKKDFFGQLEWFPTMFSFNTCCPLCFCSIKNIFAKKEKKDINSCVIHSRQLLRMIEWMVLVQVLRLYYVQKGVATKTSEWCLFFSGQYNQWKWISFRKPNTWGQNLPKIKKLGAGFPSSHLFPTIEGCVGKSAAPPAESAHR